MTAGLARTGSAPSALPQVWRDFAAFAAEGHPKGVKLTYSGRIAEFNTTLLRNAGMAGVLNRSLEQRAKLIATATLA